MNFTDPTNTVATVRDLLAQKRDKKFAAGVLQKRGMDEEDARELVQQIFKENLSTNRRASLGFIFGGGLVTAIVLGVFFTSGRLYYVLLPFSGIAFVWGLIKFLTASGYEVEPDSDVNLDDL
ncbi:MAG: hypothetical protein EPO07_08635 [Verrucomicrobia bacterium]|nr:MAG: hypothetical protein EPO07_08635 [Verrucomicrobiota bacterium]